MTEAEALARALNGDRSPAVLDRLELRLRELAPPVAPLVLAPAGPGRWLVGRFPGRIIEVEARDAWMLWLINLAITYSPRPFFVPPGCWQRRRVGARGLGPEAYKKRAQRLCDREVELLEAEGEHELAAALLRGLEARNNGALVFELRPGDVRIAT